MRSIRFLRREPLALKIAYLVAFMAFLANTLVFFSTGETNAYLVIGFNSILIVMVFRFIMWQTK